MASTPEEKKAGASLSIFSLRSPTDMGIGDINSLMQMIDWANKTNISLLDLSSITELDVTGTHPISSYALDPALLHITPALIPALTVEDIQKIATNSLLNELRNSEEVQYLKVRKLKQDILWKAFERFYNTPDRFFREKKDFEDFRKKDDFKWLKEYSLFRTLVSFNGHPNWQEWPEAQQNPPKVREWLNIQLPFVQDKFEEQILFHKFVQWLVINQWMQVKQYAESKGISLMLPASITCPINSADVWAHQELFNINLRST